MDEIDQTKQTHIGITSKENPCANLTARIIKITHAGYYEKQTSELPYYFIQRHHREQKNITSVFSNKIPEITLVDLIRGLFKRWPADPQEKSNSLPPRSLRCTPSLLQSSSESHTQLSLPR